MTFATEIQSLAGTHVPNLGSNLQCAVDWARSRVYLAGATSGGFGPYVARVGLLTGLEEAYALVSSLGSPSVPPIGIDANSDVYLIANTLYAGGIEKVSGSTLALLASGGYSTAYFGGGSYANVPVGSTQYMLDTGAGVATVGSIQVTVSGALAFEDVWPSGSRAFVCAGKSGSHKGFLLNTPPPVGGTQELTLSVINCGVSTSLTTLGSIVPSDVDAGWTEIHCNGMCVDGTDGHLLVMVYGQTAASPRNYMIKMSSVNASVIWTCEVPDSGGTDPISGGGKMMSYSRILHQKFCLLTASHFGAPPLTVTTIDTSDGTSTSFTTGLAGLTPASQTPQAFDDTIGGIVCNVSYVEGAGSPAKLNSTASSFSGWAVLYVTEEFAPPDPPEPEPGSDTVTPYVPPVIIPPVRQLRLFPRLPINSYRVTDAASAFPVSFRVNAQADLRVTVDGVELDQADFSFTGRAGSGSWYEGGVLMLDTAAEDCIVRVWSDPIPSRTTDYATGEFSKAEANAALETLWIKNRALHLQQTRDTTLPLTGTVSLPAAVAGLRYRLQGNVVATRDGSDTIYIAGSSGTILTGADESAFCEIISPKNGLWFVRTKTGTWTLDDVATADYRVTLAGDLRETLAGDQRDLL